MQQLSARRYISSDTSVSELNSISATVSIVFVLRNLVFFFNFSFYMVIVEVKSVTVLVSYRMT